MLPNQILQSDLLDILFENRNKDYGAYALRTSYNKTIKSSLFITILMCAFFLCFILFQHDKERLLTTGIISIPDSDPIQILPDKPKTPEAPKPLSHNNFRQITNSIPVISKEDIQTKQPTVNELLNNKIGDIKMNGNLIGDAPIAPPSNGNGNSATAVINTKPIVTETPLHFAEVMPEFPGGMDALRKFILKNIHQPDDLEAGQKIVVLASFVVSKTGKIENLKIVNSGRTDLDKEVLRVINKMPLWKPGMQNGSAVSVYFNLPVTFMPAQD